MAKGNKNRRRAKRSSKRMVRKNRGSRGISSLPPLQPFNKSLVNTVLRTSIVKELQADSFQVVDFTVKDVFANYPQLVACFKEVKIGRVRVWVTPTLSTSSAGVYTLCVCPKAEIDPKTDFAGLSATPGCITRKVFQTSHAVYYPTEPDERNWFMLGDSKHLFVVGLMCTGLDKTNGVDQTKMKYMITCDAHVRFRGRTTVTQAPEPEFEIVESLELMNTREC